jgi:membrane associated rhomboid family serine protease
MHGAESDTQTAVIPARTRRRAMDWSLVLASQEICATILLDEERRWVLAVDTADYERAVDTLRRYQTENRHWNWRRSLPWSETAFHWGAVPVCLLLAVIFVLSDLFPGIREAWVFDTARVRAGEWWRFFTAVLLHADMAHLLANLTCGVVLFGLVMARFGAGCGLFTAFLAGGLGNLAGLMLYSKPYTGLGASGMVMGALGLLSFHSISLWRTNPLAARDLIRGGLAGVFLFLILGVDPKSDLVAHLGGFVAGGLLGSLLSFVPKATLERPWFGVLNWSLLSVLAGFSSVLGLWRR